MVKGLVVGLLVLGFVSAPGGRASAASSPAGPRPAATLDGAWVGTLHLGAVNLRLVLKIKRAGAGWTATVDSIDQRANDIPVDTVTLDGDKLKLALPKINASYEGRLDGDRLVGTFKQNGAALPLELEKTARPPVTTARPQEPKRPLPYEELDVSVENRAAAITLACTLTEPRGKGPFGAVVLATGSGPQNRDEALMGHRPFLVLSDEITRKGVAVLRCDDRGVGKSTGTFAKATTFDFADDTLAEVRALQSRSEIDRAHVGVAGHSEGATVAAITAAKSKDVAFIVLLAGPALPGDQVSNLQRAWFERAAGETAQTIAATKAKWDAAYAVIKAEPDDAAATKKLRALYDGLSASDREQLGGPAGFDAMARELLSPWWRAFIALDPRTFLAQATVPVLALNGQLDIQVEPNANLPEIKKALAYDHDATVREMPGLNHLFQTARTGAMSEYGEIDETISPAVLTLVSDWIAHHAR
jgi:pimeloyl-ACP methyl ester carboxylesterase